MLVFAQQNAIFRSTNISIIWLGKIAIFHGMNGGWIIALSRFARMYMDMLSLSTYIRIQHWASYMLKQLSRSILHLNKYLSYFMKLRLWKMWCSRSFIWMVVAYLNWCWALTLSCCSNVIYISCSCTWDGGFFPPFRYGMIVCREFGILTTMKLLVKQHSITFHAYRPVGVVLWMFVCACVRSIWKHGIHFDEAFAQSVTSTWLLNCSQFQSTYRTLSSWMVSILLFFC